MLKKISYEEFYKNIKYPSSDPKDMGIPFIDVIEYKNHYEFKTEKIKIGDILVNNIEGDSHYHSNIAEDLLEAIYYLEKVIKIYREKEKSDKVEIELVFEPIGQGWEWDAAFQYFVDLNDGKPKKGLNVSGVNKGSFECDIKDVHMPKEILLGLDGLYPDEYDYYDTKEKYIEYRKNKKQNPLYFLEDLYRKDKFKKK